MLLLGAFVQAGEEFRWFNGSGLGDGPGKPFTVSGASFTSRSCRFYTSYMSFLLFRLGAFAAASPVGSYKFVFLDTINQ